MDIKKRLIEYREENPSSRVHHIKDSKLLSEVNSFESDTNHLAEKCAFIITGKVPKCECGNSVKFSSRFKDQTPFGGWYTFCSSSCARKSKVTVNKRKQTCIEKYGVDSYSKSELSKQTSKEPWSEEKKRDYNSLRINNSIEKYGVEHYSKTYEYKDKVKSTCQSKYGVDNVFQLESTKDKIKQTSIEKYGVEHPNKSSKIREQLSTNNAMRDRSIKLKSMYNRMLKNYSDSTLVDILISEDVDNFKLYIKNLANEYTFTNRYQIANHLQTSYINLNRLFRKFDMRDEYLLIGKGGSNLEIEVYNYVKSICSDAIPSIRSLIPGTKQEIDIWIPSKKLGIEFNGIYYHSAFSGGKDSRYHLEKTEAIESIGGQLLHIFEDEWVDPIKQSIWKSIIKSKLGLINNNIYARKCVVREINSSTSREFFDNNHLSGFVGASLHLGLYYNDKLVSAISYGKSRFSSNENEIYRFASLIETQVVGAFGKLFKHIPKDNLVSYADRRISGLESVYSKFFEKRIKLTPSWRGFNTKDFILNHRMSYSKHKLMEMFEYDHSKSAMDNMFSNGYDLIYDCGNWKYIYK